MFIDSGSTHNFLDVNIAKKLGCKMETVASVKVDVANGDSISCVSVEKGLCWNLQCTRFVTDVLILPLRSCDMVLGVQWLETLGEIKWDFKELRTEFFVNKKRHVLRGSLTSRIAFKSLSCKDLEKELTSISEPMVVQLFSTQVNNELPVECYNNKINLSDDNPALGPIQQLLKEFTAIFEEPKQLPPHRSHDHQIPLKEGSPPMNVRPYGHSSLKKNVVKKMTQELLNNGLIRPTTVVSLL